MARYMDVDGEIFRAVVTKPRNVHNPEYDRAYGLPYSERRLIPYYIPSKTETDTTVYGPFSKKGQATARINQQMKDGYGNPIEGVHGHVEKAHVVWEVVEEGGSK
jgi:hypothetical protein